MNKPTPAQIDRLRELAMMHNKPRWYRNSIVRAVKREGFTRKQAAELINDLEINMEAV